MSAFLCPVNGTSPIGFTDRRGHDRITMAVHTSPTAGSCSQSHCFNHKDGCCNYVTVTSLEGSEADTVNMR
jgi:hypothetical protein